MLEKLSGDDAVEPDQLAWLHDIGLGQPLRPAQGPAGAEVEWWKLGSMVCWGVLVFSSECSVVRRIFLYSGRRSRTQPGWLQARVAHTTGSDVRENSIKN